MDQLDLQVIERQLGRRPRGVLDIACRCFQDKPAVIITSPLIGPQNQIFPTNWWLTCPWLNRAIGFLEGQGAIEELGGQIDLTVVHGTYALQRQALIPWRQRSRLFQEAPERYEVLVERGVAGIAPPGGIKCLHTHYAYWLAGEDNPVGQWVHDHLTKEILGRYTYSCRSCGAPPACPSEGHLVVRPSKKKVRPTPSGPMGAVIDVGTNSLRLLIGQGYRQDWQPLYRGLWTNRLGEGLKATGRISHKALRRTRLALEEISQLLREHGVEKVKAVATSAVREGENGQDCVQLFAQFGLTLEVLSGQREGELSFQGARGGESVALIDIGGGSTEVVIGRQESPWMVSIPIGVVKILEEGLTAQDIQGELASYLEERPPAQKLIAVGGTATTLAAIDLGLVTYDGDLVQGHTMSRSTIVELYQCLAALPQRWREKLPGLQPERADVIPGGALLLEQIMAYLGFEQVEIKDTDLMDALMDEVLPVKEG
ncbi:MAG: DUF501 domain-containing protein [Limnochordia bacterium]